MELGNLLYVHDNNNKIKKVNKTKQKTIKWTEKNNKNA